jgi:hypothetical protein
MTAGKRKYLFCGAALLLTQSLALAQVQQKAAVGGVGSAGVTPVSRALLYRHFFAFQNYLDRMADSEQKSGKDGSALRHYNQKKLEFSDAQFGHVRAAAQGLEALLKVQDAKAARVIQAERARFPHGKLTREADLPPASAELKALQAERDSIIESAVATLKAALGPQAADKLDTFLSRDFAPNLKVRFVRTPGAAKPSPNAPAFPQEVLP